MIPVISVIICTHNRANSLAYCIESLIAQNATQDIYEVIIIDNASSDHTYEFCQKILIENPNFKYYFEEKLGLSNARNRGWKEANGVYIAYIDDDARAYPNWILEMHEFIKEYPEASVFGGPIEDYSIQMIPDWFPNVEHITLSNDSIYGSAKNEKNYIYGGNMVFKKRALSLSGGFSTALGMKGKEIGYGEETKLINDLKNNGHFVGFAEKMKVQHLIADYKISLWWLLKSCYIQGKVSQAVYGLNYSFTHCLNNLIWSILKSVKSIIIFEKIPTKRKLFNSLHGVFYAAGIWVAYFENCKKN